MQPDNELHLNQAKQTGVEAEEFGRGSVEPSPTKQDLVRVVLENYYISCDNALSILLVCSRCAEFGEVIGSWSDLIPSPTLSELLEIAEEHNGMH